MNDVVGLDIGGANLKVSDGNRSLTVPFALWKSPEKLADRIREVTATFATGAAWALTMTGELADCFSTRIEGVHFILDAVREAAGRRALSVWQTGGEFFTLDEAHEFPRLVAAANWHALASWAGRMAPSGVSLLIDIGSTTTDIIPIESGLPLSLGSTDLERLKTGELVYQGVRRTPICALIHALPLGDVQVPIARELFATTLDVALLTGDLAPDSDVCETADGNPATPGCARQRVARLLCADAEQFSDSEFVTFAQAVKQAQLDLVLHALCRVLDNCPEDPGTILISGAGEFLALAVLERLQADFTRIPEVLSLNRILGPAHSRAACSYALAILGRERL